MGPKSTAQEACACTNSTICWQYRTECFVDLGWGFPWNRVLYVPSRTKW